MTIQKLYGSWVLDPKDKKAKESFGDICINFEKDGTASYLINTEDNKEQAILLTYKVLDDKIITNQPTHPKEEVSRFLFNSDGSLTIFFENQEASFIRKPKE